MNVYRLEKAKTQPYLNKMLKHYFVEQGKLKVLMSDHETQFANNRWRRMLSAKYKH